MFTQVYVGNRADEPEPTHPGLAGDDDDRTVFVELDVADVEVEELGDAGPGVPHEHDEGPVAGFFAGIDEPGDVHPADELIDGEVTAGLFYFDVLEEFFFAFWVEVLDAVEFLVAHIHSSVGRWFKKSTGM